MSAARRPARRGFSLLAVVPSASIVAGLAVSTLAGCAAAHATGTPGGAPVGVRGGLTSGRVPAAATAVTVTGIPGLDPGPGEVSQSVTVTAPKVVQRVVALVDALPPARSGMYGCPMDTGRQMRLTFRHGADGPAVAVVAADIGGCGTVLMTTGPMTTGPMTTGSLSAAGKAATALGGGSGLATAVLSAAGLKWTGYSAGTGTAGG